MNNNPRDFLPAKYKKDLQEETDVVTDQNSTDLDVKQVNSLWSDLAKEPPVPQYRNISDTNPDKVVSPELTKIDQLADMQQNIDQNNLTGQNGFTSKKKANSKLAGLLVVFFLVIGVFASYMLSRQSQDNRQQASGGEKLCLADDPYCVNGECKPGYSFDASGKCALGGSLENCDPAQGVHEIDGKCYPKQCEKINGMIICSGNSGGDPCTEESMGGDWCDLPNTAHHETCEEVGMIRCQCGPSWWVIGDAPSCDALCDGAGIECPTCKPSEKPTKPPKTGTPTPTPTPLACGEFGCKVNSDCGAGLTCQTVKVDNKNKKICALGSNQLFCAANPTTNNCCKPQSMPVCSTIKILDKDRNEMTGDDDKKLKTGDQIFFRCNATGNKDVDFNYEFRIWVPGNNFWINLSRINDTVVRNISKPFKIDGAGHYVAQGRICWGNECQVWEKVTGAPPTNNQRISCVRDSDCAGNEFCNKQYCETKPD